MQQSYMLCLEAITYFLIYQKFLQKQTPQQKKIQEKDIDKQIQKGKS